MYTIEGNKLILDPNEFTKKQIEAIRDAVEEILEIAPSCEINAFSQLLGKNIFIRTVTYHYIGKLVSTDTGFLKIKDASWIADSGRWSDALKTGELSEVEPFPDGIILVNASSIVDVCEWKHDLPRVQK